MKTMPKGVAHTIKEALQKHADDLCGRGYEWTNGIWACGVCKRTVDHKPDCWLGHELATIRLAQVWMAEADNADTTS